MQHNTYLLFSRIMSTLLIASLANIVDLSLFAWQQPSSVILCSNWQQTKCSVLKSVLLMYTQMYRIPYSPIQVGIWKPINAWACISFCNPVNIRRWSTCTQPQILCIPWKGSHCLICVLAIIYISHMHSCFSKTAPVLETTQHVCQCFWVYLWWCMLW